MSQANGGDTLIRSLKSLGVNRVFAVPGESYLAALNGLYDHPGIELITARQEGGASIMAEAHGKLTGKPGICFVTRGPGATNASSGVHIAYQDSSPMILFIGQVATSMMDREAFQEIDYRRFFSPIAKWAGQIDDPARIVEYVNRAYHTAISGRPGPVVLALPEDVLSAPSSCSQPMPQIRPNATGISTNCVNQVVDLLENSKNPLILTGRCGWNTQTTHALEQFAKTNSIPVAVTFRCQDTFDNRHPNFIGDVGIGINPELAKAVKQADTLIVIGARLGEMTTGGYSLIDIPSPSQKLIHVYPGAEEINRTYAATYAINCAVTEFCLALKGIELKNKPNVETLNQYRKNYQHWNQVIESDSPVQLAQIMHWLSERLPKNTVITNGAGNYAGWIHRFFTFKQFHTQLAPTSGSMGYGLPAALSAKAMDRSRAVICFAGDGCLQMTIQELATAVQFKLNIIVVVVNNASWGTIRMHQEKSYPGRVKGTDLINPNFTSLAKAYGFHSELVSTTDEFAPAFERAEQSNSPALIEIIHPLEQIATNIKLSELTVSRT